MFSTTYEQPSYQFVPLVFQNLIQGYGRSEAEIACVPGRETVRDGARRDYETGDGRETGTVTLTVFRSASERSWRRWPWFLPRQPSV